MWLHGRVKGLKSRFQCFFKFQSFPSFIDQSMDIEAPVGHKYTLIWQTGEYESKNRLGIAWLPMCSSPIYHQAAGDETAFFLSVRGQNLERKWCYSEWVWYLSYYSFKHRQSSHRSVLSRLRKNDRLWRHFSGIEKILREISFELVHM